MRRVPGYLLARGASFLHRFVFLVARRAPCIEFRTPPSLWGLRLTPNATVCHAEKSDQSRKVWPATQPGNCAQITCERRNANGKDEKTVNAKSIMGRRLWTCAISEQG